MPTPTTFWDRPLPWAFLTVHACYSVLFIGMIVHVLYLKGWDHVFQLDRMTTLFTLYALWPGIPSLLLLWIEIRLKRRGKLFGRIPNS